MGAANRADLSRVAALEDRVTALATALGDGRSAMVQHLPQPIHRLGDADIHGLIPFGQIDSLAQKLFRLRHISFTQGLDARLAVVPDAASQFAFSIRARHIATLRSEKRLPASRLGLSGRFVSGLGAEAFPGCLFNDNEFHCQ